MRIVAISDVHCKWNKLTIPECDILISAGDYSFRGEKHVVRDFHKWMSKQPAKYKISVQGNHETWVEDNFGEAKATALEACPDVHFIAEGAIEIEGIKIYGSAITPFFHNWAWNRFHWDIKQHWDAIPYHTDILVTHGPPRGILDQTTYADGTLREDRLGCGYLRNRVIEVKPDLHIFGHIHASHGQVHIDGTSYYNVAVCDEMYVASNPVTVIEYNKETV